MSFSVPVIDLFAGPGGLGEGFSREPSVQFDIVVSIEKDPMAHETLRLRAAHRALRRAAAPLGTWNLWDSILGSTPWDKAFAALLQTTDSLIREACRRAQEEALHFELGPAKRELAACEIRKRLLPYGGANNLPGNAVLIGGPPCQAYSVVGRSRNRGTEGYLAEKDHRHFLYLEYLHVIAEFRPAVFVMENVKGILTSRVQDARIFETIMRDLRRPGWASGTDTEVEYVLLALPATDSLLDDPAPEDFIVRAEDYGVPQARHRVIILGVRRDVYDSARCAPKLVKTNPIGVWDVICDLPALRPQLSFRGKGLEWLDALQSPLFNETVSELKRGTTKCGLDVAAKLVALRKKLRDRGLDPGFGGDRKVLSPARAKRRPKKLGRWFRDRPTQLLANHASRSHMPSDVVRYLFVAAFGEVTKTSPRLKDFPKCLLPDHKNIDPENIHESIFKDRFRVQIGSQQSTTVTSHIAKDGHAFIHPKAYQCRSLTVREAARLQTFPDSYVFLGNRTSQYTQVGNAVPPYLARQIAGIVSKIIRDADLAKG